MKPGFEPGIVRDVFVEVTEDMCPAFDGAVIHRCYSTWSVAHHMEIVARKVLIGFLEEDEEAVGSHLSVDHLAPCQLGRIVRLRATLAEVSGGHHPKVVCDILVFDGDRLLARGKQVQVVMNKEHLTRYIERS